jgi:predicted nuclease with TOPRIM domain
MTCAGCDASRDLINYQSRKLSELRRELAKLREDYETMKAQYDDVSERLDKTYGILPY